MPGTPLLPAQAEPEILADMNAQNSWVVVDWKGRKYSRFTAIAYVCRLSPLFHPLAPLLKWRPIMSLGTRAYESIASNRRTAAKITNSLQFRPLRVRSSPSATILALFFLVCILLWNLNSIAPSVFQLPKGIHSISLVLGLDQRWNMFAPYPPKTDGWYVIPGQLQDGTEIDVFKEGKPVSWEKPSLVSATYPNQRWRKYMMNIFQKKNAKYRLYYGRYLCRNWNAQHKGSKRLETFQIYFMLEKTLANYQPSKVEKLLLWKHTCSKPPKENE